MVFGIVMTVILVLAGLSLNLTSMRFVPLGFKLLPFAEAVLLWIYVLPRGNKGWLGVLFLVQFYIMLVFIVSMASVGFVGGVLDREHNIGPVTLGNPQGNKTIVAVYHPGGSDYTGRVLRALGDELAGTEYKLVMYGARRDLRVDLSQTAALILASPVYAGQIRPPVTKFLERDLAGVNCALVLTGGVPNVEESEYAKAVPLIEAKGGEVVAKAKFVQTKDQAMFKEEVAAFAEALVKALAKGK